MTFEEMQEQVYIQLRDAPKEFIEDRFVEGWLNEGQRDIAQRTKLLVKGVVPVWAGGETALPDDFIDVTTLRLGIDDVDFELTEEDFWRIKDNGGYIHPPVGRIGAGVIEVLPAPVDGAGGFMRYAYLPPKLVDPGDVSEFPEELQDKMVLFAISRALYKEREDQLAAEIRNEYEAGLPQRTLGFGRKYTSKMSMRWEPGAFDVDPEARHL